MSMTTSSGYRSSRRLLRQSSLPGIYHERTLANKTNSATSNLPTETLSLIFEYACPNPDFSDIVQSHDHRGSETLRRVYHLTLGLVCTHWHEIILGTPQLWTDVILDLKKTVGMVAGDWDQLLGHYSARSGALPISLEIRFLEVAQQEAVIDAALRQFGGRLRSLVLLNILGSFSPRLSHEYPLLRELAIIIQDEDIIPFPLMVTRAPSLSRFAFWAPEDVWEGSELVLPWSSITHIDMSNGPFRSYIETLIMCANLVDYRSYYRRSRDSGRSPPVPEGSHTLPHLRSLEWSGALGEASINGMLRRIQLPALERLYLHYEHWGYPRIPWEQFFQNLPRTVTLLTLDGFHVNESEGVLPYPEFFFEHMPNLRELRLLSWGVMFLDDVFMVLGSQVTSSGLQVPKYLPKLRTVRVRAISKTEEVEGYIADMQRSLNEMVCCRYSGCTRTPEYCFDTVHYPTKYEIAEVDVILHIRQ